MRISRDSPISRVVAPASRLLLDGRTKERFLPKSFLTLPEVIMCFQRKYCFSAKDMIDR